MDENTQDTLSTMTGRHQDLPRTVRLRKPGGGRPLRERQHELKRVCCCAVFGAGQCSSKVRPLRIFLGAFLRYAGDNNKR